MPDQEALYLHSLERVAAAAREVVEVAARLGDDFSADTIAVHVLRERVEAHMARPVPLPDPNVLPHTDGWEIRDTSLRQN